MPPTTGTVEFYATGLAQYLAGDLPVNDAGALKGMLVTATYVVDQEAHTNKTHITNEVSGGDWPVGGVTLTGVAVTVVAVSDLVRFDFTTIQKTDCTFIGAKRLIIYYDIPALDTDKTLFAAIILVDVLSPTGGAVVIAAPSGLFTAEY